MVPLSGSTPSTESTISFSTFSGPFYSTESTDSTEPMLSTDTTWPTSSTESTWPTHTTETLMSTDHTSGKIYSGTSGRLLCLFFLLLVVLEVAVLLRHHLHLHQL